jgi:putative hydrolase of the HAD superfamily
VRVKALTNPVLLTNREVDMTFPQRAGPRVMIRAVTFDLWLTLIWDSKELEEYRKLRRMLNFHRFVNRVSSKGKSLERVDFNSIRLSTEKLGVQVNEIYDKGRDVSPEDRGRMMFELLGIKFDSSEARELELQAGRILSDAGYYRRYPHLNPEAGPVLRALKKRNLKVGLISNAARSSRTYRRMLNSYGIGKYFDALTISCEVGYLKPAREIFHDSMTKLSVEPHEAIHVGDLFKADVVGAVSFGMHAAHYTGLWHKYAQYMNPGEHIPENFEIPRHRVVREIKSLKQVPNIIDGIG